MTMIDLTVDEIEVIRRIRLSIEDRAAEDAGRLAAARAVALAYATPEERARMEKIAQLKANELEALRSVTCYINAKEALKPVMKEVAVLAADKVPPILVVVPPELLTAEISPVELPTVKGEQVP
jgi:predicted DNA-binding protein (UPF0251 family)